MRRGSRCGIGRRNQEDNLILYLQVVEYPDNVLIIFRVGEEASYILLKLHLPGKVTHEEHTGTERQVEEDFVPFEIII